MLQDCAQALEREQQACTRCDELAAAFQQHSGPGLAQGQDNADQAVDGSGNGNGTDSDSATVVASFPPAVASLTDQIATLTQQLDTLTQQATQRDHLLHSLEETHAATTEALRQSDLRIVELSAQKLACEKRLASLQKEADKLTKALERTHKVRCRRDPHTRPYRPSYIHSYRPSFIPAYVSTFINTLS